MLVDVFYIKHPRRLFDSYWDIKRIDFSSGNFILVGLYDVILLDRSRFSIRVLP